jgi:nitroimidazol reductase NimA-like FMN-containing flavoprotein (pyridoxamine 5'-phosphate oxidase superfamily)
MKLEELREFVHKFVQEKYMSVVSSVINGEPRSFTCWYVFCDGKLYWKSRVASEHSTAFALSPKASLCIYDHNAGYPDDKVGVQVLGVVGKVTDSEEMQNVVNEFAKRFGQKVLEKNKIEDLVAPDTKSTFYSFTPEKFKLVNKDFNVHMEAYEDFFE